MNSNKDRIFLEGLEARCVIGIFDWERKIKQRVLIDFEILTDAKRSAKRDNIKAAIDYKTLTKRVLSEVPKTRFKLVESLAEFIADLCLKEFGVREITVRVSKPGAIRGARNVGVQITRHK
ncbi:MAG: dihydroneopterin aldolase [Candidatus Omnitrophica bacterium]|nr:dihydroneopterin aldolase [Candidatus Omnitrophota bacterium]